MVIPSLGPFLVSLERQCELGSFKDESRSHSLLPSVPLATFTSCQLRSRARLSQTKPQALTPRPLESVSSSMGWFPAQPPENSNTPFCGAFQPRQLFLHVSGQPCLRPGPQRSRLQNGHMVVPSSQGCCEDLIHEYMERSQSSGWPVAMLYCYYCLLLLLSHLSRFCFSQHHVVGGAVAFHCPAKETETQRG